MRGHFLRALALTAVLLAGPVASQPPATPVAPAPPANAVAGGHPLDSADLEAWLDGFMAHALKAGDIPGAVVVVVKDGQLLAERGYGYADLRAKTPVDPRRTLFRAGSISKLFTWTAVMQLAEEGKLDLGRDVNAYLDFRIPPRDGRPITLRELMTHTAGFEANNKQLFFSSAATQRPLAAYLKASLPERIFAPGEVVAYSNYGAALAGYIVQRVSGEPFDRYVADHIFAPLGMTHASFRQPLTGELAADMSKGYLGGVSPAPFELVGPSPAGALSISGDDMARFMIAHLQDGRYGSAQILRPETAERMHRLAYQPAPPLPGMALGFYQEDRNGLRIVGHAGDTQEFHSDLHLLLDKGVGLFISFNSPGVASVNGRLRADLFDGFLDRYFPGPPLAEEPTLATARAHGAMLAGRYLDSRREVSNFPSLTNMLSQIELTVDKQGVVTGFHGLDGRLKHWREVQPFVWREVGGSSRLAAKVEGGRVVQVLNDDLPPVLVVQPAPLAQSGAWQGPLFAATLAVLLTATLSWPLAAVIRRRYGRPFALAGAAATGHRLARLACLVNVLFLIAWIVLFARALSGSLNLLDTPLDPWLYAIYALGAVGALASLGALYNLVVVWRDAARSWWARLSSLLITAACLSMVFFDLAYHLTSFSVKY